MDVKMLGGECRNVWSLKVDSAKANSGQSADGAPLRKEELVARRVLDGLKQIVDSGESGCLRMCPKYLIR